MSVPGRIHDAAPCRGRDIPDTDAPPAEGAEGEESFFGGDVPEGVRAIIDAAREAPRESKASILELARHLAPECLPVYYLLYKLHAASGQLERAEEVAVAALDQAARQAGLPAVVDVDAPLPSHVRFDGGPARFWLFTLKALAFIGVRRGDTEEARRLLQVVARHDPKHSVGSEVTLALVEAVSTP